MTYDNYDELDEESQVPARSCTGPPYRTGEAPRHPRPAGVNAGLAWASTGDYYPGDEAPPGPLDLQPFLDALAAHWDRCHPCLKHHTTTVAADPVLTTHVIGVTLLAIGIQESSPTVLTRALDPTGAGLAVTIRNAGLPSAVDLAGRVPADQRRHVVEMAVKALIPTDWLLASAGDFSPPTAAPPSGPADTRWLDMLRQAGHLP